VLCAKWSILACVLFNQLSGRSAELAGHHTRQGVHPICTLSGELLIFKCIGLTVCHTCADP
jgi:hypothetical protein